MLTLSQRAFEKLDIYRQYTKERVRVVLLKQFHLSFKP